MKPIVVNNSIVPVILSYFGPVEIYAMMIWPFIFCREEMDELTLNHETIHFEQCNELLVVGFFAIYLFDYIKGLIKYGNGEDAYFRLRAEQEAYHNDQDKFYLLTRKRYAWLREFKV